MNKNKIILEELFENSIFNDRIFELLTKIADNPKLIDSLHTNEEVQTELATIRNRNLITHDQQKKLANTVIGFFGMSVGSHAALTWMLLSRAKQIKISDPDFISSTNLNRLRFGWDSVGKKKIDLVSQQIIDINPSTIVHKFDSPKIDLMSDIVTEKPKVDLIVDEIDNLKGKVELRKLAKQYKIPLISATDVGDNVFLDIERYDTQPETELFFGRVPGIESIDLKNLSINQRKELVFKIVGFEHNSEEMLDSLSKIGHDLITWPQLGSTATMTGGIIATTIKKIILGEKIKSGRYYISLDQILVSDFDSSERKAVRDNLIDFLTK